MDIITIIHVTLAVTATISGAIVMSRKKGDIFHTRWGKLFVASMVFVNITAFAFLPKYGFTIFQPLALWNLVWVICGYYYAAKKPNKNWLINHFYFMTYAYVGVVAAAVARIPLSFGFLPYESAFIAIAFVFGISVYVIEKQGKKLRALGV
jgi:uncharacterized membrane protein|tara:strand:+ start:23 stop:475 length:453 start_codon:yes stop_codon:yes gene_type:complete